MSWEHCLRSILTISILADKFFSDKFLMGDPGWPKLSDTV